MKNWICCICPSNTLHPPLPSAAGPQASFDQKSCLSWQKWRKLNLRLQAASQVYCTLPAGISASTFLVFVPLDWKVKVKVLVAQLYLHLCDPMDCSLPGSSVNGILQARILEWVAIPFSRRSSQPRDRTQVFWIAGRFFTNWATRDAPQIIYIPWSNGVITEMQHCSVLKYSSQCNLPY